MVAKKKMYRPRTISIVAFVVSVLSLLLTTLFNEQMIFNQYFSTAYTNALSAKQKLITEESIHSTDKGFQDILPFLVDANTSLDRVEKVEVMGEGMAVAAPFNISDHTYWFFDTENRKVGENQIQDNDLLWRITNTFYTPLMNGLIGLKSLLQFILGAVAVFATGVEVFVPQRQH